MSESDNTDFKQARRKQAPQTLDKLPPNSTEAEQGALACLLINPKIAIPEFVEFMGDDYIDSFYDLRHQTICKVIVKIHEKGDPVDLISVHQKLKDVNLLEGCGGIVYISQLLDLTPSAANLSYYAGILKEKLVLRRAIKTCSGVVGRIYDYEGEVDELMDEVERDMRQITESRSTGKLVPIRDTVNKAVGILESYFSGTGDAVGLSTGYADLNWLWGGLRPAEMIVIAARPSTGKTALMMGIVEHVALDLGHPVGVFSLEMSSESLVMRTICSRGRVSIRAMKDGAATEADFPKITTAASQIANSKIRIDDTPGLSIMQLRTRARRMHQQYGIKLFCIDYLQLLHATSKRARENRQQEISDISTGIKELAKELNVPIIALAQLNRDIEKDKTRKPRMSDLRESGALEQDADIIGMLYEPNRDGDDGKQEQSNAREVNLLTVKQRNGPKGETRFTFMTDYTRFELAPKLREEDMPE